MYIYEQISIYCDFSNNNNNNEAASKVPSSLVLETKGLNLERQPGRGPALLRVGGSRAASTPVQVGLGGSVAQKLGRTHSQPQEVGSGADWGDPGSAGETPQRTLAPHPHPTVLRLRCGSTGLLVAAWCPVCP